HLIEGASAIVPTGALFTNAAPLLKEKCRPCLAACGLDLSDPLLGHRSRTRPALAADNRPVNSRQVSPGHGTQQGFERNKPDCSPDPAQIVDAREIVG